MRDIHLRVIPNQPTAVAAAGSKTLRDVGIAIRMAGPVQENARSPLPSMCFNSRQGIGRWLGIHLLALGGAVRSGESQHRFFAERLEFWSELEFALAVKRGPFAIAARFDRGPVPLGPHEGVGELCRLAGTIETVR